MSNFLNSGSSKDDSDFLMKTMDTQTEFNSDLDKYLIEAAYMRHEEFSDHAESFTARQFLGDELWHCISQDFTPSEVGRRISLLALAGRLPILSLGRNAENAKLYRVK